MFKKVKDSSLVCFGFCLLGILLSADHELPPLCFCRKFCATKPFLLNTSLNGNRSGFCFSLCFCPSFSSFLIHEVYFLAALQSAAALRRKQIYWILLAAQSQQTAWLFFLFLEEAVGDPTLISASASQRVTLREVWHDFQQASGRILCCFPTMWPTKIEHLI